MIRRTTLAATLAVSSAMALAAGIAGAQQPGEILDSTPQQDGTLIPPGQRLEDGTVLEQLNDGSLLEPDLDLEFVPDLMEVEEPRIVAVSAGGAVLRGLDKMANEVVDMQVDRGQTVAFGKLQVTLGGCRYPEGNPSGDAYAYLVIRHEGQEEPLFEGWMVASSPALNALDDPRYDVWVLRCRIASGEGGSG